MNNSPCCKRCETDDGYKPMCMIPSCPCHNSLCCEKCIKNKTWSLKGPGQIWCADCPCHSNSQEKQETNHPECLDVSHTEAVHMEFGCGAQGYRRQPSEAWEQEFSGLWSDCFNSGDELRFPFQMRGMKDFIRQKIAEAREDERNNTTGPGRTYQNGFEAGLAQGKEEGIRSSEGYLAIKKSFYEDGKQDALKECLEVADTLEKANASSEDYKQGEHWSTFGYPKAFDEFKQQITSLLK